MYGRVNLGYILNMNIAKTKPASPISSKTTLPLSKSEIASYIFAAIALFAVVKFGLLVALFAGLLVYSLVHLLAPAIEKRYSGKTSRTIAVVLLSALIILAISAALWAAVVFLRSDASNLQHLLQKLADMIEASRSQLPQWVSTYLPDGVDALRQWMTDWLREHAGEAKGLGQKAGHIAVQLILGMIIGSMVALNDATNDVTHDTTVSDQKHSKRPLADALVQRVVNMSLMFRKIVFAQVYISSINTVFTAIYLMVVLPLLGVHLPLIKSMIAITFLAGLIPVVGNIVSNTVIVIVALSYSLPIAVGSLAFMVVIHKLEYFLNARIIGSQINAKSWEMLTAILVMETLFGMPGVVAAPVFYAYIKKELMDRGLV
jgi:predicted PurR-regulated permease PerM